MHAVVVAHGPKSTTKEAVARLRRARVVDSIWVVRSRSGVRINRRVEPGVEHPEETGTAGVRFVATSIGPEPMLLIHDDVAITAGGIEAMLGLLGSGADFVAPWTNERNTPGFIGPLPRANEAGSRLNDTDGLPDQRSVLAARHACVLGTGASFANLRGSFVVPGSSLVPSGNSLVLAPALAAHDLSCNARLEPDIGDRPLLVASMIVRDEETMLAGALESVAGLADRVEICDTGSVDGTIAVAESMGAHVREIEWRNDFAWARNQALESCRDAEYALLFDADERILVDDPPTFRRWLRTWRSELDAILCDVRNDRGEGGSASSNRSVRIAVAEALRFEGPIHEVVKLGDKSADDSRLIFHSGLHVEHLGYRAEVMESKNKAQRNIAISRAVYEADPGPKSMIDYARSLRMADEADPRAESLFRQALAELPPGHPPMARSYLLAAVSAYEMEAGRADEAIALAQEAIGLVPNEDVALRTLAHALSAAGETERLVAIWESVCRRPPGAPMFLVERNLHSFEASVAGALCTLDRFDEAVELLVGLLPTKLPQVVEIAGNALRPLVERGAMDSVVRLVAADGSGALIQVSARLVPPEATAELAVLALERGGENPELVVTGSTAALIKDRLDLVERALQFAGLVDSIRLTKLGALARRRGHAGPASYLDRAALDAIEPDALRSVA